MKLREFLENDIISYLDSLQETPDYKINPAGQEEIEQLLQKSQQDEKEQSVNSSSNTQPVQKEIIREVIHDHTPAHVQDMHVEDSIFPSEQQRRLQKDFSHQDIAQQDIPLHNQKEPVSPSSQQISSNQSGTQAVYMQQSAPPQISPAQIQEMIQQEVKGLLAASSFAPSQQKSEVQKNSTETTHSTEEQAIKIRQEIEQSLHGEILQLQNALHQLQQEKDEASQQREHLAQELQRTKAISLQREEQLKKDKNEEIAKLSKTLKALEKSEHNVQEEIRKLHAKSNKISSRSQQATPKPLRQQKFKDFTSLPSQLRRQPREKGQGLEINSTSRNDDSFSSLPKHSLESTNLQAKSAPGNQVQQQTNSQEINKREEYSLLLTLEKDLNKLKKSLGQKNYDKALLEYQTLKKQAAGIRYHSFQKKLLFDQLKNVATILELADQKRKRAKEDRNAKTQCKSPGILAPQAWQPKSSQEIHEGLEKYVKALQAIKEQDKLTALRLLIDLSKKHPHHRGVKLHLQEALQL